MTVRNFVLAVVIASAAFTFAAGAAIAVWWNTYTVTISRSSIGGGIPVTTVCVERPSRIFPSRDGLVVVKVEACTEDASEAIKVY